MGFLMSGVCWGISLLLIVKGYTDTLDSTFLVAASLFAVAGMIGLRSKD